MKSNLDFLFALREESISDKKINHNQLIKIGHEVIALFSFYKGSHPSAAETSQLNAQLSKIQTVKEAVLFLNNLQTSLHETYQQQSTSTSAQPTLASSSSTRSSSSSSTSSTSQSRQEEQQDSTSASTSTSSSSIVASPKRVLRPKDDPADLQSIPPLNLDETPSPRRSVSSRIKKIEEPKSATAANAQKLLVARALKKTKKRDKNKPRFQKSTSLLSLSATPSVIKNEIKRQDSDIATSSSSNEGAVLERKSGFTGLTTEQLEEIRNPNLNSTSLSSSSTADIKDKGVVIAGKLPTFPSPQSSEKKGRDR